MIDPILSKLDFFPLIIIAAELAGAAALSSGALPFSIGDIAGLWTGGIEGSDPLLLYGGEDGGNWEGGEGGAGAGAGTGSGG